MKLAALFAAAGSAALASGPTTPPPPVASVLSIHSVPSDSFPWRLGERLEFGVKFGLFNVGRGALEVVARDTVRGTPVTMVRFTLNGGALGYDLTDSMQSWFGDDLVTRRFWHQSNEDGRLRDRRWEIFPEQRLAVRQTGDTIPTVADPLDDASFFYFARTLPLEVGQTYTIPRYFIADRNPVQIRVMQYQTIGTALGRRRCIVVQPVFKSRGMFGQGGRALIWFTDDSLRLPVKIRAGLPIGTLEMQLRSVR